MDAPPPMKPYASRSQGNPAKGLAVVVLLPWLVFILVVFLFAFVFGSFARTVWYILLLVGALSALISALYESRTRESHPKIFFGILIFAASVLGSLFGDHVQRNFTHEYSRIVNGAKYHNVQPAEPAASHADASIITFTKNSAIDTLRALGSRTANNIYCVAPILDGTEVDNTVNYWAVGKNCCLDRADFECDDALDQNAEGGIPYSEDYRYMPEYEEAIREAKKVYNLESAKSLILVRWLTDPTKVAELLWKSGLYLVAGACLVYFAASVLFAVAMSRMVQSRSTPDLKEMHPGLLYGSGPHELQNSGSDPQFIHGSNDPNQGYCGC